MLFTVRAPTWKVEEDSRILSVGEEEVRSWLTFQEVERWAPPAEQVNLIHGVAVPLRHGCSGKSLSLVGSWATRS